MRPTYDQRDKIGELQAELDRLDMDLMTGAIDLETLEDDEECEECDTPLAGGKCPECEPDGEDEGESADFYADAMEYADHLCTHGAHFGIRDNLPKWVSKALSGMQQAFKSVIRAFGHGNSTESAAAGEQVLRAMTDALAAGHLEGTAEVLQDIANLEADLDTTPDLGIGVDGPTAVPRVPVGEAVADVVARNPVIARTAQAVAQKYREGEAFAMARSASRNITVRAQEIVAKAIEQGGGLASPSVDELAALSDDFTRAYAETVIKTNVNTAMTEGRFRAAQHPAAKGLVLAFKLMTSGGANVRRGRKEDRGENHAAANGLIAAIDDPIWVQVATPAGYGCECRIRPMTKFQLERAGLLDSDGKVKRYIPAGIGQYRRHPNFDRTRMPGT